jgi:hypothetical protein
MFSLFMDISNIKTKLQHLFTLLQFKESFHINISYKVSTIINERYFAHNSNLKWIIIIKINHLC